MVNNEQKFAQILEDVKYTAKENGGYISDAEVKESFAGMDLSDEQFELVYAYLKEHNIGINEPLNADENMSEDEQGVLNDYSKQIKDVSESLNEGELRAYIMQAMNNDENAKSKIVSFYLPKVMDIARLYVNQGIPYEDLLGEGNLSLMEGVNMLGALENPDEAEGMLMKVIMDAMEEAVSENMSEIKTEEEVAKKVNDVADKAKALSEEIGRKVTVKELAEESDFTEEDIIEAYKLSGKKIEDIEYTDEAD